MIFGRGKFSTGERTGSSLDRELPPTVGWLLTRTFSPLLFITQSHKATEGGRGMKENDRGKLAVAPPKKKDDSPSISRETARSFFVALWLGVFGVPGEAWSI